jgi:hypothetical protein
MKNTLQAALCLGFKKSSYYCNTSITSHNGHYVKLCITLLSATIAAYPPTGYLP